MNQNWKEEDHFAQFESDEYFTPKREASLSSLGPDAKPDRFSWLFDTKNFASEDPYDLTKLEALH